MAKIALLKIGNGDFEQGFAVSLQLWQIQGSLLGTWDGFLPPQANLESLYLYWLQAFRNLTARGARRKSDPEDDDDDLRPDPSFVTHRTESEDCEACRHWMQLLESQMQEWLQNSDRGWQKIRERLAREFATTGGATRLVIQSDNLQLWRLPWHVWDLLEANPQVGIGYSSSEFEYRSRPMRSRPRNQAPKVRILAILGDRENLDLQRDRASIEALKQVDAHFLDQPSPRQLIQTLRDPQGWDIFFFAGHSSTHQDQGRIYLSDRESLEIAQFKNALNEALDNGLKIAFFNSCEGLGLAQQLADLQLPVTLVMQEVVPDDVASSFIPHFLYEYAQGQPLSIAVRIAQSRLEEFTQLPGCTWLPLIAQNPAEITPQWRDLLQLDPPKPKAPQRPLNRRFGCQVAAISTGMTLGIMALRAVGLLQPLELLIYDHIVRSRPPQVIDDRILVVEITETDLELYQGYPISDALLARLLRELSQHNPRAIGMDIHRHTPQGSGRPALNQELQKNDNIFGVCAFGTNNPDYLPPDIIPLEHHDRRLGFSNLILDDPKVKSSHFRTDLAVSQAPNPSNLSVRRQLLSYTPNLNPAPSRCTTPYSLSFQLAFQYLHEVGIQPLIVNENHHWQFGEVVFQPLPNRFGAYQNLDGLSNQIAIHYRSAPPGQRVSLQTILAGDFQPEWITDRLVLIGYSATVAEDTFDTPYGKMAGIWIHAHMTSQMLSAVLDERPLIWAFPLWGDGLWVWAWSSLAGGVAILVACCCHNPLRFWLLSFTGANLVILLVYGTSFILFLEGGWLPVMPAMLAIALTGLGSAIAYRWDDGT
jgi:CHASE2 domain-containing sensor protein